MMTTLRKSANLVRKFASVRSGAVMATAGFVFPLIFVAAGGALDYTNAVKTTQDGQRAMDATVLSLASRNLSGAELQAEGKKLLNSLLKEKQLGTHATEVSFREVGAAVSGTAKLRTDTYFLGYIGLDKIHGHIGSKATAPGRTPIEISLVLDVSGSMKDDLNGAPRIERVKTAVNGMLDTLDNSLSDTSNVKIALVPYSSSVNITGISGITAATSVNGAPAPAPGAGDLWAAERSMTAAGTAFTLDDASPVARAVPFVTEPEMSSAQPRIGITPLTSNRGTLRTALRAMTPSGWTAGHIGMAWGVYTLSDRWGSVWPSAPKPHGDTDKVIVILSDGEFNTTHNIGARSTSDDLTSYAYFDAVCDFAESKGIAIYAVALNLDPVSAAKLGNCAANGGRLYPANSASDLSNAFKDIARRVGRLRLTS